jgi:hypothetical protein
MRVVLASCAVLAMATGSDASGLEVAIQAADATFSSTEAVRFWVMLRNPLQENCTPLIVDPVLASHPPPVSGPFARRPLSIVRLEVKDARGVAVLPRHKVDPTPSALRVHELLILRCGQSYGWDAWAARIPWGYELSPGRYTARARVAIPMASFFKNRDGLESQLESLWGDWVRPLIRDLEAESGEVTFAVARSK